MAGAELTAAAAAPMPTNILRVVFISALPVPVFPELFLSRTGYALGKSLTFAQSCKCERFVVALQQGHWAPRDTPHLT